MNLLVCGWTCIPHSYSIVNVHQIVHLLKNFPDMRVYVLEEAYYKQEWQEKADPTFSMYPLEYREYMSKVIPWKGQVIDLVYNITFPYNIDMLSFHGDIIKKLPKCVFYTSEFCQLDVNYFKLTLGVVSDNTIEDHIRNNPSLFFTSPSKWSQVGMRNYAVPDERNKVITHGVDTKVFYRTSNKRRMKVREYYGVKPDELLLTNIGAMTRNKGITSILETIHLLLQSGKACKLFLKGTGDLYETRGFLKQYLDEFKERGFTDAQLTRLTDAIIFTDATLSFSALNDVYNATDLYMSPYIAEGFNMVPLEVLAAGTRVLLPSTGSTVDYSEKIGGESVITVPSTVSTGRMKQNLIRVSDILDVMTNDLTRTSDTEYKRVRDVLERELSWDVVAQRLKEYFDVMV